MTAQRNPTEDVLDEIESLFDLFEGKTKEELEALFGHPEVSASADQLMQRFEEFKKTQDKCLAMFEDLTKEIKQVIPDIDQLLDKAPSPETKHLEKRGKKLEEQATHLLGESSGEINKSDKQPKKSKLLSKSQRLGKWKKM